MTADRAPSAVVRAAVAALAVGLGLVAVGALASGSAAAYGALVGTAISVGIFAFGAFAVDAVSRLMPAASLLFAMVTYTLQVVLMALAFVTVNRAGLLDDELDRTWLGAAIIAGAFVWIAVQIRLSTTARIPAFHPTEGGAR